MTPETKCVETIVVTAATIIIVIAKKDMFFETRHVGRLLQSVSAKKKEVFIDNPIFDTPKRRKAGETRLFGVFWGEII